MVVSLGLIIGLFFAFIQGYSSLAVALVLPESGRLVACERDAKCLEVAKRFYDRAGVSHKVIFFFIYCTGTSFIK